MSETIKGPWFLIQIQEFIETADIIWIDEFLGLRGWGLIIYGILPSYLSFLGILDTKLPDIDKFSVFFILGASTIPLVFIFVLIHNENKNWYLTKDKYGIRSLTITFIIVFLSTLIFGISGIVHKKYSLCICWNLETLRVVAECFISAISSLIISSSFFMIVLTHETNFPLLPSVSFAKSIAKIERNIRKIKTEKIWIAYTDIDDSFVNLVVETRKEVNKIKISKGHNLAKISLNQNYEDLIILEEIIMKIKEDRGEESKNIDWKIYFDCSSNLTVDQLIRRSKDEKTFNSLERLRNLELSD